MSIETDRIKVELDNCDPLWHTSFTSLREAATFWQLEELWWEVFDEALSDQTELHFTDNVGVAFESLEEFGVEYDEQEY